jgi:hypothetical protein
METTEKFECDDTYEAEKLSSLTAVQEDNSTYIHNIADVIENEIIIILKDKSCHSILMKDSSNAMKLKELLLQIVQGKKTISKSSFDHYVTKITITQ